MMTDEDDHPTLPPSTAASRSSGKKSSSGKQRSEPSPDEHSRDTLYVGQVERPDEFEIRDPRDASRAGGVWPASRRGDHGRAPEFAIKQLLPPPGYSTIDWPAPEVTQRWQRQLEAIRRWPNDHLVRYHELFCGWPPHPRHACFGEPPDALRTWYVITEWVEGTALPELVRRGEVTPFQSEAWHREAVGALADLRSRSNLPWSPSSEPFAFEARNIVVNTRRGPVVVDFARFGADGTPSESADGSSREGADGSSRQGPVGSSREEEPPREHSDDLRGLRRETTGAATSVTPRPPRRSGRGVLVALLSGLLVLAAVGTGLVLWAPWQTTKTSAPSHPPAHSTNTSGPAAAPIDMSAVPADQTDFLVALTLSEYFGGINHHDYLQSYDVLAPPLQGVQQGYDNFASGYATTNDSSIVVGNVYDASDGEVEVALSFTSNQAPLPANDEEQCTVWSMHYGLVQNPSRGSPFLIASAENVGPVYQSC